MEIKELPIKAREPGRPRAIPEEYECIVRNLYNHGYGYRAIAQVLQCPDYGLNPHYTSVRQCVIRLGVIKEKGDTTQ